jgi:hypothetical protein
MNARWPLRRPLRLRLWLLLGAVLVASVALKLGIGHLAAPDAQPGTRAAVSALLERQGLTVRGVETDLDLTLIRADRAPACQMTVALMAPQGWHGGVIASLAGDTAPVFVFGGAVYDTQPALRARARLYWTLLLRQLGVRAAFHPLLGVIATPGCDARALPWGEVAAIALPDQAGTAARK